MTPEGVFSWAVVWGLVWPAFLVGFLPFVPVMLAIHIYGYIKNPPHPMWWRKFRSRYIKGPYLWRVYK